MVMWRHLTRVGRWTVESQAFQANKSISRTPCRGCYQVNKPTPSVDANVRVVDMRSDTFTLPSKGMLEAMVNAPLGDDVHGEDPTVNALQKKMAAAFGKEASLFVTSGSMGNLVSIMSYCDSRGSEIILGSDCHVHVYEQGGVASIAGVHHRAVKNNPDGTYDLETVRRSVRDPSDPHFPITRAILVENTHNKCGGRVLPLSFLKELRDLADDFELPVHMDGARVMNAAVALDVDVKEIVQYVDSVSMCFSKGIGAPFGGILAGGEDFIKRALRHRKVLGGGLRQAGLMAAAAEYGFDRARTTLAGDHRRAQLFAVGIAEAVRSCPVVEMDDAIDSNMIFLRFAQEVRSVDVVDRLNTVTESEKVDGGEACIVRTLPETADSVRMVASLNLSDEDIELAIRKVQRVVRELERESRTGQREAAN